ncbi:hypothetical protein MRQ36_27020 [Micromonospora sp. R77]|uniref:hypothetical protein n=1 Tax=Micromonospora sp. R77 TaxID=2925836 RepID=UPI001F604A36|nr:hypothetical protein [Micromonospora sp. R77]MCI4066003.1 hypothetical protein [Micromonospora sp. R77]
MVLAGLTLAGGATVTTASPAMAGQDALARVYVDGKIAAEGKFISYGDSFQLTKRSSYGGRPYLEYKYIRIDGTVQEGTHWGLSDVGKPVSWDHNFGEGRAVAFRVCVQVTYGWDPCSDDDGQWTVGYA